MRTTVVDRTSATSSASRACWPTSKVDSEQPLSLDELSGIAAFSRHHFHRQFSGFLGMSAYKLRAVHAHAARVVAPCVPSRDVRERHCARHGLRRPGGFRARLPPVLRPIAERLSRRTRLARMAFTLPAVHPPEADHHEYASGAASGARRALSRDAAWRCWSIAAARCDWATASGRSSNGERLTSCRRS